VAVNPDVNSNKGVALQTLAGFQDRHLSYNNQSVSSLIRKTINGNELALD